MAARFAGSDSFVSAKWHVYEAVLILLFLFVSSVIVRNAAADSSTLPLHYHPSGLNPIDTLALNIRLSPKGSYASVKTSIRSKRDFLAGRCNGRIDNDSLLAAAKAVFEESLVNRLLPFWYGTKWDFNGYTPTPGKGTIACGYFVSTLLLHCGCNVNRYALAQQNPLNEALTIQGSDSVQIYSSGSDAFVHEFKRKNPEGLYFAGLDYHVGFLLYRSGELLFIHSSYIDPLCVVIEKAAASRAFNETSTYTIARISTNKKLLGGWLRGARIEVIRE